MNRCIDADYSQEFLLPPSLEEWVDAKHPARFIRTFVEACDVEKLSICWGSGHTGRPPYSATLLLKVWLYGYYTGIRSTRKLEFACREHMGFLWLTGMNAPDHNTLARFFSQNKTALRGLFKQSVHVGVKAGLVGMVVHALDGTKIGAKAATGSANSRDKLTPLLAKLEETLEAWEDQIEHSNASGESGAELPEDVQNDAALRDRVREALAGLDEAGVNHLHPQDPDARVMKCSDINARRLAYNSQAVADADSGLIVAQDVTSEAFDQHQLTPMLDRAEQTLGGCAQTTLADAGYATSQALAQAEEKDRKVLVNLPARMAGDPNHPYHASHFVYDEDKDVVVCPRGEELIHQHTRAHNGKGQKLDLYRCKNKTCPVRDQCTKERKGRSIELGPNHGALARQRKLHAEPQEKALLKRRAGIIEKVFGAIKQNSGFRRYTRHGIENAKTEWAMVCTAYNLKKLYKAGCT